MSLFDNSIESIQVGVEDYLTKDPKRYLSAVRNISAGILLLYKEKLRRLSPPHGCEILIKQDIRPGYDDDGNVAFFGRGKKTVDVQGIKERFSALDIKVDWKKFDELNRLRNEIEHYYTDKSSSAVREIVAKSFILIRDFIHDSLEEEPCGCLGVECWQALLETADVYAAEEKICQESLERIDWKYPTLRNALSKLRCPTCHSSLVKTEDEEEYTYCELICSSCGEEFYFSDVIEQCLSESLAGEAYIAMKHGGGAPLGTCPSCGAGTFMFAEGVCAVCGYEPEYLECYICGTYLSLEEQCFSGLCCYHYNLVHKDD